MAVLEAVFEGVCVGVCVAVRELDADMVDVAVGEKDGVLLLEGVCVGEGLAVRDGGVLHTLPTGS